MMRGIWRQVIDLYMQSITIYGSTKIKGIVQYA